MLCTDCMHNDVCRRYLSRKRLYKAEKECVFFNDVRKWEKLPALLPISGDTVYVVSDNGSEVIPYTITKTIRKFGEDFSLKFQALAIGKDRAAEDVVFKRQDIGKTIFLSIEEALRKGKMISPIEMQEMKRLAETLKYSFLSMSKEEKYEVMKILFE